MPRNSFCPPSLLKQNTVCYLAVFLQNPEKWAVKGTVIPFFSGRKRDTDTLSRSPRAPPPMSTGGRAGAQGPACDTRVAPAPPPRACLAHVVADGGIPVDEALYVAVDAAARGEVGECGWVSLPLPLPHHQLAGLPLRQHLLVPRCHHCVHLYSDHTVTMGRGAPSPPLSGLGQLETGLGQRGEDRGAVWLPRSSAMFLSG